MSFGNHICYTPVQRSFVLPSGGQSKPLDAVAIFQEVLKELDPHERSAVLRYMTEIYGSVVRSV